MVLLGFYEASSTSARNRPHEPTASKPVVPRGYVAHIVVRMDGFDVVVVGGGPAGEGAAGRLGGAGVEGALGEEHAGGGARVRVGERRRRGGRVLVLRLHAVEGALAARGVSARGTAHPRRGRGRDRRAGRAGGARPPQRGHPRPR